MLFFCELDVIRDRPRLWPGSVPPTPFLNTVRRWLPRATAHSRRARHTRTPTPTPGDGTNTGLHPPHYPAHYRPPLRTRTPQDRRGKKELTGWSEHN